MIRRTSILLVAVAAAALVVAAPSSPRNQDECGPWELPLEHVLSRFHVNPVPPPSKSSENGLAGTKGVICAVGPLEAVIYTPPTIVTFQLLSPKSGTIVKGVCTTASEFTGTNTTATIDAATGKTTMKTQQTVNLLCFHQSTPETIVELIFMQPREHPLNSLKVFSAEKGIFLRYKW